MNSIRNRAYPKKQVSTELHTDQGKGIMQKLKVAAKQLNDKIQLHTLGVSAKFSELPITPEYYQPLVNQSDVFPGPHQATTSF